MDTTEFRKRGKEMVDYIADYMDGIHTRRVLPEVQPGYLREMLPGTAPRTGEPWDDIMKDVNRAIMPGAASPACTELEIIVLDWLAKMIGLPQVFMHESGLGGGVLQGSASDGVLVSLLAARYAALKDLKQKFPYMEEGILLSKLVGYCSKMAHSCVEKAGMISLVKMRELEVDDDLSLRGTTLHAAIKVCCTLGTTAACSFDNLAELGLICDRESVWLHVDAAYAGSGFICPEFQHLLNGIEHANSFNTNPTKWMLVNFDCSALWVRDRKVLTEALTVDPLYLQHSHSDKAVDFRHWGITLSRRFRALKLWFVIRSYGVEGLQKYIRLHVRLAKQMEVLVKSDLRFEVMVKVSMGLVCFRLKGGNYRTQTLLRAINMSGKLHMVPALVGDLYIIRFAVCAEHATADDITHAWNVISQMAGEVIEVCDSNRDSEEAAERLVDLHLENNPIPHNQEQEVVAEAEPKTNGSSLDDYEEDDNNDDEEEEVFLYDDNIPSIPSIPSLHNISRAAGVDPNRRRNILLRMISDPKCYNPRVLRSLSQDGKQGGVEPKRHLSSGGDADPDSTDEYV